MIIVNHECSDNLLHQIIATPGQLSPPLPWFYLKAVLRGGEMLNVIIVILFYLIIGKITVYLSNKVHLKIYNRSLRPDEELHLHLFWPMFWAFMVSTIFKGR